MGIIHSCTADKTVGGELEKMKQLLANMKAKSASFILLLLIIITVFIFWSFRFQISPTRLPGIAHSPRSASQSAPPGIDRGPLQEVKCIGRCPRPPTRG